MEKVNENKVDYVARCFEYEEVLNKNSVSIDTLQNLINGIWCEIFESSELSDEHIAEIRCNYKSAQAKMYIIDDVIEAMQARNASII